MKTFALVVSTALLTAASSAVVADPMPYFGTEPIRGSTWNGPEADFPNTIARGYGAYAQASCRYARVRHVAGNGVAYFRTRRVCY